MNNRQYAFLKLLLETPEVQPYSYYSNKLGNVSTKTLQRDLNAIEEYITTYQGEILKLPSKGISIKISEEDHLLLLGQMQSHHLNKLEKNDRKTNILLQLLVFSDERFSLNQMSSEYFVSKTTILNDLNEIEHNLQMFSLKLEKNHLGSILVGNEKNIRLALQTLIIDILADNSNIETLNNQVLGSYYYSVISKTILDIFNEKQITFANTIVSDLQQNFGINFQEKEYFSICIFILTMIYRNLNGYYLEDNNDDCEDCFLLEECKNIVLQLKNSFSFTYLESEYKSLYEYLKTTQFIKVIEKNKTNRTEHINQIFYDFVDTLSHVTNVNFRANKQLLADLEYHVHAMLHRIFFGNQISNPLKGDVISTYSELFTLCKRVWNILSRKYDFDEPINDEISLLILYVQLTLLMEREKMRVLVCSSLSERLSTILLNQLETIFPEWRFTYTNSLIEKQATIGQYDFVLTTDTNLIGGYKIRFLKISPIITEKDIKSITNFYDLIKQDEDIKNRLLLKSIIELRDLGCRFQIDVLDSREFKNSSTNDISFVLNESSNFCKIIVSQNEVIELTFAMKSYDMLLFSVKLFYELIDKTNHIDEELLNLLKEAESFYD